jgi:asparagine synthase (glutamine-hydrolysing)
MCGICGAVDFSRDLNAAGLVRLMTPTMRHRGPDDEGYLGDQRVSFGMRRLSIIDIEGGHQPIFNDDGTVGLVLNGEIYNFQELRQQLADRGHSFHTRSDSEVVVHAYEEWGAGCVERLQGMFALAIWDQREFQVSSSRFQVRPELGELSADDIRTGKLFIARDRLGIKPLYYYAQGAEFQVSSFKFQVGPELETRHSKLETASPEPGTWNLKPGTFLFASEVRTLLASGVVPRVLSRDAVESYLLFGSVSEPLTLIDGVYSLPPGHHLTMEIKAGVPASAQVERYWSIANPPATAGGTDKNGSPPATAGGTDKNGKSSANGSEPPAVAGGSSVAASANNAKSRANGSEPPAVAGAPSTVAASARRVRSLLEESVRGHLIADVPVGVFLSSGIDSTALAALASREVSGVHTFTVAFPEGEFNEAAMARRTARTLGTTHSEVMLSGDDMLARLDEAVSALDLPTMDGINTYFVSASAREAGLKVALSGLGGDEVFGGYASFRRTPRYQRLARAGSHVPSGMRWAMATAMSEAGERFMPGDAARKLAALWQDSGWLPDPYYFGRLLFTPVQVSGLMIGGTNLGARSAWRDWLTASAQRARRLDSFAAVSCLEAESYLVNTLLRDTDSMSMAHSLEVRVPFLDHPLVEFVTHLPQEMKLAKNTPKALLVAALGDLLPAEVVNQTKRGFTFPWAQWLRGPLKSRIENGLADLSPALREIVGAKSALAVWQSYLDGKTTWSRPWSLYVLNEWTKRNVDN